MTKQKFNGSSKTTLSIIHSHKIEVAAKLNTFVQSKQDRTAIATLIAKLKQQNSKPKSLTTQPKCLLLTVTNTKGKQALVAFMAEQSNQQVFQANLKHIVNTFIGETEKNLDAILANAAQNNWILFFDEADALFGKRTKIKDSHDKYANIEVSNLLQKMDKHKGFMVLSSNSETTVDPAFLPHLHRINSIRKQKIRYYSAGLSY